MAAIGWLYPNSSSPPHAKAACPQIVARQCCPWGAPQCGRAAFTTHRASLWHSSRTGQTGQRSPPRSSKALAQASRIEQGEAKGGERRGVRCVAGIGHVEAPLAAPLIVPV